MKENHKTNPQVSPQGFAGTKQGFAGTKQGFAGTKVTEAMAPEKEDTQAPNPIQVYINETWSASPSLHQNPEYISPLDLWDVCNEFFSLSKDEVTHHMQELGFKRILIENEPYYVVFPR